VAGTRDTRAVEEALGQSIVDSIGYFLFRDIETQSEAEELFEFVKDASDQGRLASAFRGARWQQKVGLMFARPVGHPAHSAQVRSQVIEYGAICESALRCMLIQNGRRSPPHALAAIIERCKSAGILTVEGRDAADRLRLGRNAVHLFVGRQKKLSAEKDARKAYRDLTGVLNECRERSGLDRWHFGRSPISGTDEAAPAPV
jgi:hypothetical protein